MIASTAGTQDLTWSSALLGVCRCSFWQCSASHDGLLALPTIATGNRPESWQRSRQMIKPDSIEPTVTGAYLRAGNPRTSPELLKALSQSPCEALRIRVAENPNTP